MAERLKDMFLTRESMEAFAAAIQDSYPDFDKERFYELVFSGGFAELKLKDRMSHTTRCLQKTLPGSFPEAVEVLIRAVPHVAGFEAMCLPDFIAQFGFNDDWDLSLKALGRISRRITGELAIRPFLDKDPDRVLPYLWEWTDDEAPVLRRLASEGSRPRLPWAMALPRFKKNPGVILPILEKLKDDPSEDVRRSVANHVNDISKDNPDIALELCSRWYGKSANVDKIVKHACRTLLKAGDSRALQIFGYSDPAGIQVKNLTLETDAVFIGDDLRFVFALKLKAEGKVRLEYAISYVKSQGKLSRKVFKLAESSYPAGTRNFKRKHSFADMSTRKHFPGIHHLGIIVNGEEKAHASFEVHSQS
jgi:3-methyladenine DNA glycosylase AlkC